MSAVSSYAGEVRHLLCVTEQDLAGLAIADFTDQLAAAESDTERMVICHRWHSRIREVRKLECEHEV